MAPIPLITLLVLVLLVATATTQGVANAAPTTTGPTEQQRARLRALSKALLPKADPDTLEKTFGADMTVAQYEAVGRVMTPLDASTPLILLHIMGELARSANELKRGRSLVPEAGMAALRVAGTAAGITYCADTPEKLKAFNCGSKCKDASAAGMVPYAPLMSKNNFAFAAVSQKLKSIFIAFRGTDNDGNRASNGDGVFVDWPFNKLPTTPKVHRGFSSSYGELRAQVVQVAGELVKKYPDFTLVFTGHSLGGAMATLAAADVAASKVAPPSRIQLLSFAAPRLGDQTFADTFDKLGLGQVIRYTSFNDPIPVAVPRALGYRHHSGEVNTVGKDVYRCNGQEDELCSVARLPFVDPNEHLTLFSKAFFGDNICT